ncbi:ankyrin repeat protein [Trichoderma sp. SZMC 28013]
MSSAPASTLAVTSALAIDIFARFPAEIINHIWDNLHPSLIYFHLFVEPKSALVQSSSEECQRVREICISHNVKHGRIDIPTYAFSSNDQETVNGIANYLNRRYRCFDKSIILAAQDQNMVLTRLLLEKGASPDITNDDTDTSLHFVAKHNNSEAIEMFHDDVDMVEIYLQSPLLNLNMRNFMKLLLTWSGNLEEYRDIHRKTPLVLCLAKMASLKDMTPYIPPFKQLLITKGVDPQAFSKQYETVLKDVLDGYDSCF